MRLSIPTNWIVKISFGYLLLPFMFFCLGFLKLWIGIPLVAILAWIGWRIWKQFSGASGAPQNTRSDLILGLIILGIWVLLSGIGGFVFQNSDHHIRNAIFRDLIQYDWPVYYPLRPDQPSGFSYTLVYYIGFWLPAALVGKLLGWQTANLALFFWTWLGVFLTVMLLKERIKSTILAAAVLLIFFSGMDILGTLFIQVNSLWPYPTLWPPFTFIEKWGGPFLFLSSTTQLNFVFNQSVPAWVCIGLILNTVNHRYVYFIWALCFFFAPIPALGLLPFTFLVVPRKAFNPENISIKWQPRRIISFLRNFFSDIWDTISPENLIGGGLVLLVTGFYFSGNTNSSKVDFFHINVSTFLFYIIFLAIEGILLWSLLYKEKWKNLWWYITAGMMASTPLILFGDSSDFCMKASIPALFLLMTWVGEALFQKPALKVRAVLIVLLILGAFTPLYEINRAIYRTANYYFHFHPPMDIPTSSQGVGLPSEFAELDHPFSLTADMYPSLAVFKPEDIPNFIGKSNTSNFFKFLAKSPQSR